MSTIARQEHPEVQCGITALRLCVSDIILMPIADCVAACLTPQLHYLLICDDAQIQISQHTVRCPQLSEQHEHEPEDVITLSIHPLSHKSCLWPDLWGYAESTSDVASGVVFDGAPCFVLLSSRKRTLIIIRLRAALEKAAPDPSNNSCWTNVSMADVHEEKGLLMPIFPFSITRNPLDATQVLVTCPQTKSLSTYQLRRKDDDPVSTPPVRLVSMQTDFGKWALGMSHFLGASSSAPIRNHSSSKLQQRIAVVDAIDEGVFLYDLVSQSVVAKRQLLASADLPKPHRCRYWPKEDAVVIAMAVNDSCLFAWCNVSHITDQQTVSEDDATSAASPVQCFEPPRDYNPTSSDFRFGVSSLFIDPLNGDLILGWTKGTSRFTSMKNLEEAWTQKTQWERSPLPRKVASSGEPVIAFI